MVRLLHLPQRATQRWPARPWPLPPTAPRLAQGSPPTERAGKCSAGDLPAAAGQVRLFRARPRRWSTPDAQRQETPGPRASGPGVSLRHAPPPIRGDSATARAVETHGVMGHVGDRPKAMGRRQCLRSKQQNRPRSGPWPTSRHPRTCLDPSAKRGPPETLHELIAPIHRHSIGELEPCSPACGC